MGNKTLVAFYSLGGNTRAVAQKIAGALNADMVEIQTQTPYVGTYDDIVNLAKRQVRDKYTPPIVPIDIAQYDRIVVGTPTWWYTMAPAVRTFLTDTKFAGRRVDVYITHAGWPGTGVADMRALAATGGGNCGTSTDVQFDGNDMQTPDDKLTQWINGLK